MIRNDAERDGGLEFIAEQGAVGPRLWIDVRVCFTAQILQFAEQRREHVSRIIARFDRKIGEALSVLNDRACALKAHSGIDVFGG